MVSPSLAGWTSAAPRADDRKAIHLPGAGTRLDLGARLVRQVRLGREYAVKYSRNYLLDF
jgi:hypothetical protein